MQELRTRRNRQVVMAGMLRTVRTGRAGGALLGATGREDNSSRGRSMRQAQSRKDRNSRRAEIGNR
jgi:hypothetical protein